MKLAIFGATGKTGIELVKQALDQGHAVTAFVRDSARLTIEDENLTIVTGDVFDPASVTQAVQGQDAVICALGAGSELKKTTVRTTGTINIIEEKQGIFEARKGKYRGQFTIHFSDDTQTRVVPILFKNIMYLYDLSPRKSMFLRSERTPSYREYQEAVKN